MAFIYYVTQIHLDFGTVGLLPAECARAGMTRPLSVTDACVDLEMTAAMLDELAGASRARRGRPASG